MSHDGLAWLEPEDRTPRGTLLVLGGRGESANLYRSFATLLGAAGYRVGVLGDITDDLPSARSWIATLLADDTYPCPKVLIGSDTGALLALRLGIHAELGIDGIVVAGAPVNSGTARRPLSAVGTEPKVVGPVPEPLRVVDPHHVRTPVLALHGRNDTVAPMGPALEIYRALPRSEIVMIDTARHHILDGATDLTAAAIVAFLERLEGAPARLESR